MENLTIPILGCIIPNMGTIVETKSGRSVGGPSGGVADALFTKVQQRVLAVLFGNPGRSFYANEIIALAGSGTGAVQRELARLAGAGLLKVSRTGNQKHYQANSAAPIFEELRGIVLKTSGLVDLLYAALAPVAPEILAAFVFGSTAKGKDAAGSDIDLFVISESLSYSDLFSTLEEAGARLGRKVNPTIYTGKDLAARRRQGNAFVNRILSQPKLWVIGNEDGLPA